jgi:hypothetical protein
MTFPDVTTKLQEKNQSALKVMHVMFTALKDLRCTMQFHLKLQSMAR